jgi:hypothetical protein
MVMDLIANNLPGNSSAMHPPTGANLVDIPDSSTDSIMIKLDPVLQMRSVGVIGMVDYLQRIAPFRLYVTCFRTRFGQNCYARRHFGDKMSRRDRGILRVLKTTLCIALASFG